MRKILFLGTILGVALVAMAAKDPVIMKINGKDVRLSEFEYLYQKNNKQQLEKESLEEYVNRFVIYKLKVAEAEEMRLDTIASFVKEYEGYKKELSAPYLEEKSVNDRLSKECYERMKRNVDVTNIYVSLGTDDKTKAEKKQKIDSLYQCLKKGENIEELAYKCSEDRSAKKNRGRLGYIKVGMFPYVFEYTAFNTPVGEISKPFKSAYGWHLLKVNAERPDQGSVLVEHILKLFPRNADEKAKKEVFDKVSVLYEQVVNGANFEELAKKESEDPGSAKNGGKLPWFGTKTMVPEFEEIAFVLKDGEISKPFETQYGVHIIKKLASKPIGEYAEYERTISNMIKQDERGRMAKDEKMNAIKAEFGYAENEKLPSYVDMLINKAGGNDSVFVQYLRHSDIEAYKIGKKSVSLSDATKEIVWRKTTSAEGEKMAVEYAVKNSAEKELSEKYVNKLYENDAYFHNLLDEYHDGMLLFEISNRKIWDGAAKDTEGLKKYFDEHKQSYKWKEPKYKGIAILAVNDSIMQEAKDFLSANENAKSRLDDLKEKFGKQVNVEYILAGRGENALVDYEIYKTGEKPKSKRYASSFMYSGNMIDSPEEYTDVKVQLISDYQDQLEKEWVKSLKSKYPVRINKNVLKLVKE